MTYDLRINLTTHYKIHQPINESSGGHLQYKYFHLSLSEVSLNSFGIYLTRGRGWSGDLERPHHTFPIGQQCPGRQQQWLPATSTRATRLGSTLHPLKTCPVTGREYLCSKNMRLPPPVRGYSKNHSQSPILSVYNEETMAGRSGVIGPRSPSSLESK